MNADLLERILACPTLPSLPATAARVIALTRDPDTTIDELVRVIQNDQGLSAKLLRTANSSFSGLRRPCATVGQAIVLLGLSTVKALAIGFSLVPSLQQGGGIFDYAAYWRRALFTAVAARAFAQRLRYPFADEAFLGGLLQDIGMVAMHRALGERYEQVVAAAGHHRRLAHQELAAFELQHADIGAMLAERWDFPHELIMPVKFHERPTAAPPAHADLVRCVGLGNLVHDALTDADPSAVVARLRAQVTDWVGLESADAAAIMQRTAAAAAELAALLNLPAAEAPDAQSAIDLAGSTENAPPTPHPELDALVIDSDRMDPIVGALGREPCLRLGQDLFFGAQTRRSPLAVLAIAVDRFEELIADHGLEAGDAVLVETVAFLTKRFEAVGGIIGRYADATLVLAIPGTGHEDAVKSAAALRHDLSAASPRWGIGRTGAPLRITVSIGAASYDPRTPSPYTRAQQLFNAAVQACQSAAAAGGNSIRTFVPRAAA